MIKDRIGRHEVLLPIYYKNNNFQKIQMKQKTHGQLNTHLVIRAWISPTTCILGTLKLNHSNSLFVVCPAPFWRKGQASFVCESCTVFRVFRNIPSSSLSRFIQYVTAKFTRNLHCTKNQSTMFLRGCELLTSDNWASSAKIGGQVTSCARICMHFEYISSMFWSHNTKRKLIKTASPAKSN